MVRPSLALLFSILLAACGSGTAANTPEGSGGDGSSITGGATGGSPTTGGTSGSTECFPFAPRCNEGVVQFRFAYYCADTHYSCSLGCRAGENPSGADFPFYCEETAVRHEGFPCRADIDCATPEGTEQFFADAGTDVGGPLHCDPDSLQCAPGEPAIAAVAGECAGYLGFEQSPSVSLDTSCESGACLINPGETRGECSRACAQDLDCPDGWGCELTVDQRYTPWSTAVPRREVEIFPRLRVCVRG